MKSEFAVRLRRMRDRKGISRQTMAELCGVNEKSIARYERGERIPGLEDAEKLADFFGMTIDSLWKGKDKKFF